MNRLLLAFFVLSGLLVSCKKTNDPADAQPKTISDVLAETPTFSLLRAAVQQAGLTDALKAGQLTLFAPTDDAFKTAGYATVEAIRAAPVEQLRNILRYHVVNGAISTQTKELAGAQNLPVEASNQGTLLLTNAANGLFVNGNLVTKADQVVANGYVHTIGRVLTPSATDAISTIKNRPDLSLLSAAITRVGTSRPDLVQILNGTTTNANLRQLTIFAPNDDAFKAAGYRTVADITNAPVATLSNILTYHVVQGFLFASQLQTGPVTSLNPTVSNRLAVTVNGSTVTIKGNRNTTLAVVKEANVFGGNAVIHVIDQVLLP